MMITRELTVRFTTPAFLGDADQSGYWRAPPFKSLLRRWWRVAWSGAHEPSQWRQMRLVEGGLFGHAWLDPKKREDRVSARKSCVRLRIDSWAPGQMKAMPQTRPAGEGRRAVASALYLGYGPVKTATELKMRHPVDAERTAKLVLAFPDDREGAEFLDAALGLAHGFGAVGGRSSNGWGSICLEQQGEPLPVTGTTPVLRDWKACFEEEWPHAIGNDDRPLVWTMNEVKPDWKSVIEELARVRKAVNESADTRRERMILNQPVAGKGGRMPSQLRFKVRRTTAGDLHGCIYHLPHTPPPLRGVDAKLIHAVWAGIHGLLDQDRNLSRVDA